MGPCGAQDTTPTTERTLRSCDDKAPPRCLDHGWSVLQVVEFQGTANLGLLKRPRQRLVLRPERIIDPRQPVEGESFQYQQRYR